MSGIASITPVWQQVKPTDVSRYIDGMADTYDKQNQVIKDQIKVFDTMFNNAQQHKMNEVQQALNAFSLEDYNAPDARAKFDEIVANASKEIGGFNAANQLTMDTIWDKRGDTLVERARADINLNNSQRDNTLKNEEVLVNNTAAQLHLLTKNLEELPQESEGYKQTVERINKLSSEFGEKYPHLANRVQYAIDEIAQKDKGQDIAGIKQDTDWYTAVTDKYLPLYMQYMEVDDEIGKRYSNIGDLKGDELKKAQDNKALDEAARDEQFGDLRKQMQDPFVRSALIQRATEAFTKGQMDRAKYEKVLSGIKVDNARAEAIPIQAQASLNTSNAALQNADNNTYEVVSDAELKREELAANQTKEAAKVTKAASVTALEGMGIKGNVSVFLNDDGTANPDKIKARYLEWGKEVASLYEQGFPKGLSINTLPKGVYDKANKVLVEQSGSSAMTTLKTWMRDSKLSAGDQALIVQGIADGRLPVTTGRWLEVRNHKDSKMSAHAKDTITKFLQTEKASYKATLLPTIYTEGNKYIKAIMYAEGTSSVEEHMKKNNSFYASSLGNYQLRWTLDPSMMKVHNQSSGSTAPTRTTNIPKEVTSGGTGTVGKGNATTGSSRSTGGQNWRDLSNGGSW